MSVFFLTFKLNCSESQGGGLVPVPWYGGANPPTPAEGEIRILYFQLLELFCLEWPHPVFRFSCETVGLTDPWRASQYTFCAILPGVQMGCPQDTLWTTSTAPLKRTHYSIPSHRRVHTPSHRKISCFLGTFLTHLRLTIISLLVCASGVLSDKWLLEKWKQACLFKCARGGTDLVHALIWYISASKMVPGLYYGIKYQHFGNSYSSVHSRDGVGVSGTSLPKYSRFSLECIFIILF